MGLPHRDRRRDTSASMVYRVRKQLVEEGVEAVNNLIAHCQSPEAGGFTASDFPLARLEARTLNKLSILLEDG